jgi:hypothetical protein
VEVVLAALVTGLLTLAGALGAVILSQRAENKRLENQTALRRLDHDHDHRERLQTERLTAYRVFDEGFLRHRRVYETLGTNWTGRRLWTSRLSSSQTPEERQHAIEMFDSVDREWQASVKQGLQATEELEDSLAGVALVASSVVYQKAVDLKDLAAQAWTARRELADVVDQPESYFDLWQKVETSEAALENGRVELENCRRVELGLDRGVGPET